jgi:hypothetical protein
MRFIYVSHRLDRVRDCFVSREVTVWKITRAPEPVLVGKMSGRNLDAIQMVALILRKEKAVPAKFRKPGSSSSFHTHDLKEAGIHISCIYEDGGPSDQRLSRSR